MSFEDLNDFSPTELLDFDDPSIENLVRGRGWRSLSRDDRIGAAYAFVKDEILFGYNRSDELPASRILEDGYGQCNTKGTLLAALLNALDVRCRIHGFVIHKELQRGLVPSLVFRFAPDRILHSWVEVLSENGWVDLEGFILDSAFIERLQEAFPEAEELCGYGAGTDRLKDPGLDWRGKDTYIQRTGIEEDLGTFPTPDEFYASHAQSMGSFRSLVYGRFIRHWMNRRVSAIRAGKMIPKSRHTHSHDRRAETRA